MLDLAADLVAQMASNSLAVFCFCNLLVVIILISPKPGSDYDEGSEFHLPIPTHSSSVMDELRDIEPPPEDEETSPEVMELCVRESLEKEGGSYTGEGEDYKEDDRESDNDDDGEFRRKIEAFIDKVNREWKAEKLRTRYLCEQVDF
ncbi:uncharacterized protein J3R85_011214 [Psidium guajava]|nr:uncharacterized protein J3R85_011214 [Psidium guajava]